MNTFSAQMTVSVTPNNEFINFYNILMKNYLERKEQNSDIKASEYDEFAEAIINLTDKNLINDIFAKNHTLYLLPQSHSPFDLSDFYKQNSKNILRHEFIKWFGTEEIATLLLKENIYNQENALHNLFSLRFYSYYLNLNETNNRTLFLAISPGKSLKIWLSEVVKKDVKARINLLRNNPSPLFDSYTTFVINSNFSDRNDIDSFLEKNVDTIIRYKRAAWFGDASNSDPILKWPADLNHLNKFKEWFHIEIFEDVCDPLNPQQYQGCPIKKFV